MLCAQGKQEEPVRENARLGRLCAKRRPALMRAWGGRTVRVAEQQRPLGLVLGGSAEVRLSHGLSLPASRKASLQLVL
jgi:hypothetical protein